MESTKRKRSTIKNGFQTAATDTNTKAVNDTEKDQQKRHHQRKEPAKPIRKQKRSTNANTNVNACESAASNEKASVANDTKKSNGKRTAGKKKTSAPKEKRAKRIRKSLPSSLQDRLERSTSQPLYLIRRDDDKKQILSKLSCEFDLLGSTGNVYQVTLSHVPSCTCPDFQRRGDLCKHIFFILIKVIGLNQSNPLSYQKAYVTSELKTLFEMLQSRRVGGGDGVQACECVQESYAKLLAKDTESDDKNNDQDNGGIKRRSLDEYSDCPICFDTMNANDISKITYCRAACGTNFHADCIRRWCLQHGSNATCPNCRQSWVGVENPTKGKKKDEGFVNLGHLQGQSRTRDTSTYNSPSYSSYGWSRRR